MNKFIIYPLSTQGKVKQGESKKSKAIPAPPHGAGLKSHTNILTPPLLQGGENPRGV